MIRYGMMRDQILVWKPLADGTVLSSMNKIIKNNTGYDLNSYLLGPWHPGIVTRLVLKLRPAPTSQNMAFLAASTFDEVTRLLNRSMQVLAVRSALLKSCGLITTSW